MRRHYVGARVGSVFASLVVLVGSAMIFGVMIKAVFNNEEEMQTRIIILLIWIFAILFMLVGAGWLIVNFILMSREGMARKGIKTQGHVNGIIQTWTSFGNACSVEVGFENVKGESCVSIIPIAAITRNMYKSGDIITVYVSGDYGTISKRM